MPQTILSVDGTRVLVLPRAIIPSFKDTRVEQKMIRHEQKKAIKRMKHRAERAVEQAALKLQQELNCNRRRCARPKAGSLRDRENSDPSDGEEEEVIFFKGKSPPSAPSKTISSIAAPQKAQPDIPRKPTAANRPVRCCPRGRSSLADVEHSAGSDDEEHVLPKWGLTTKEAVGVLLSLRITK